MLKLRPYAIRTEEEALREGYRQAPEFYVPFAEPLLETLVGVERKLEELRALTPYERAMNWPVLEPYSSILRYSFIIVKQDFGFCFWRRSITGDN